MLLNFTNTDGGGGVDAWAGICPVKMTHECEGWEELWGECYYDTL